MERLWQRPSNLGTESSQLPLGLSSSWDTLWHGDGDQGRGEGHREHCVTDLDKVKITELISHINITDGNILPRLSPLIRVLLPCLPSNFNPPPARSP